MKIASLRTRKVRPRRRKALERTLEAWCVEKAKEQGWRSRKMNGLGFRDWPDRLFIRPPTSVVTKGSLKMYRSVVWVEFKRKGKKPTANQLLLHNFLRQCGAYVRVIDTPDKFLELLHE